MHIARVVQSRHRLPLETPLQTAWDPEPRDFLDIDLVWVESDDGRAGVGAGPMVPGISAYADLFIGRDPLDLQRHNRVIESLSFHVGPCWPLDIALWDLAGQIYGEPVWRLLGGSSGRLVTAAGLGDTKDVDELAELAADALAEGFPAILLRLTDESWQADVDRVMAVRKRVGHELTILTDWRQGAPMPWEADRVRPLDQTLSMASALDVLGVGWFEDPAHRGDYRTLSGLRRNSKAKLAGGAHARDLHDIRNLITRDAIDVVRADATRLGGITGLFPVMKRARERGLSVSPFSWSHGIAMLANAHLAAASGACRFFEYPVDPPALLPEQRDFLLIRPIMTTEEGTIDLGDTPGLGLTFDDDMLQDTEIPVD